MLLFFLIIVGFGAIAAVINAMLGAERGLSYFDMMVIGIIFTPLMTLLICVSALLMDKR
ncbi:MAG: hypothetical protein ACK5V5_03720 [Cyclobacteriaceae bacterium]|jgi:hypothetical protein